MDRDISCFVIMPFSQTSAEHTEAYWTSFFDNYLKPIIDTHPRIYAFRSTARREDLLSEIIKNLVTQQIVVADLTDQNPNVFWELGVRQSFQHRTITIAQYGTRLPFDLGKKGTLFYYPKDAIKSEAFRIELGQAIQDCIDNPDRPDSIVLESISGRGSLFEIIRKDESKRRIYALNTEYLFNFNNLNTIIERIKANIKIRSKMKKKDTVTENIQYITIRFRSSSIELLVANRYLDALDIFYKKAETYYDDLLSLNDQLRTWENGEEFFEGIHDKGN